MFGGVCPGGFCPGGFCPRGDFVQGILSGGFCPGGFCPGHFVPEPNNINSEYRALLQLSDEGGVLLTGTRGRGGVSAKIKEIN